MVTAWEGHQCAFLPWAGLRDASLSLCLLQDRGLGDCQQHVLLLAIFLTEKLIIR